MKPLFLILKTPWFILIGGGEKTIEYRKDTPYWRRRLLNYWECLVYKCHRPEVVFQHGYASDALRLRADITGLTFRDGFIEIHIANVREEKR